MEELAENKSKVISKRDRFIICVCAVILLGTLLGGIQFFIHIQRKNCSTELLQGMEEIQEATDSYVGFFEEPVNITNAMYQDSNWLPTEFMGISGSVYAYPTNIVSKYVSKVSGVTSNEARDNDAACIFYFVSDDACDSGDLSTLNMGASYLYEQSVQSAGNNILLSITGSYPLNKLGIHVSDFYYVREAGYYSEDEEIDREVSNELITMSTSAANVDDPLPYAELVFGLDKNTNQLICFFMYPNTDNYEEYVHQLKVRMYNIINQHRLKDGESQDESVSENVTSETDGDGSETNNSSGSSSRNSSSGKNTEGDSSYDTGYDDVKDNDTYDEDRYNSDIQYQTGVDDALEDYYEEYGEYYE